MLHDQTLEMVTEIFQGAIAVALILVLGAIALIEAVQGRSFTEPTTLGVATGAAIGFYFGQRNQRRQQDTISNLTEKLINGNGGGGGSK